MADDTPGPQGATRTFVRDDRTPSAIGRLVASHLRALKSPEVGTEGATTDVTVTIRSYTDRVEVLFESPAARTTHGQSFGSWLVGRLRLEGISQEAAARRLGVSLKTVNRWVRGHTEPRLRELRRVRAVFGEPPLD
jgi:DNA-binding transcriptional regulator YiaG